LGLLFALVCLGLSFYGIDLAEVAATLRNTSLGWLGLALTMVAAATLAKGLRWRILLYHDASAAQGDPGIQPLSVWRLTNIWLAGASLNLALPIPRSGDLARAYLAGEAGQLSKARVLGTVAAEKLLDMVMLAVCFLLLLSVVALPAELAARQTSVIGMAAVLVAVVALVLWQRDRLMAGARWFLARLPGSWGPRLIGALTRAMAGLEALRSPRAVVLLAFWSVVVWLLSTAINNAVFLAMGWPSSWVASLFVLVVLQAGIILPSTPGKVGVFQVLCRWSLVFLGYPAAVGVAYGVLLYLVAPVTYMAAGALALLWESWQARTGRASAPGGLTVFLEGDEAAVLAQGTPVRQAAPQPAGAERREP
jgi:hypothetical protein